MTGWLSLAKSGLNNYIHIDIKGVEKLTDFYIRFTTMVLVKQFLKLGNSFIGIVLSSSS